MPLHYPAQRILSRPSLYIGSIDNATSIQWLRQKRIGLIVNATHPNDVPSPFSNRIRTVRVPVWDTPDDNGVMLSYLDEVVDLVHAARTRGTNVLVHCRAGISRSSTVVASYLIKYYNMTPRQAVAYIQSKKPETFAGGVTRLGVFGLALRRYSQMIAH